MLRCKPIACILGIVLAACGALPGLVQAQRLQDLRGKSDFGADDVDRIDAWIQGQMGDLERGLSTDRRRPQVDFVERILQEQGGGSPAFKRTFAERCSALFSARIKSSNGQMSYGLLIALDALGHPATLSGLEDVADSPDPVVRLLAIRGVGHLAAGSAGEPVAADQVLPTIGWLADAGQRESDAVVLRTIYMAIASFQQNRDEQARALLRILQDRRLRLEGAQLAGEAADATAYIMLISGPSRSDPSDDLRRALTPEDEVRLVQTTAAFLAKYCDRLLTTATPESEPDLLRLTVLCERLLSQVSSVNTTVTSALAAAESERHDKILAAARAWFGTPSQNGALNGGRWQVPVGGGVAGVSFAE